VVGEVALGSSITRIRAFWLAALAISTICCCAMLN
jgi:hypothetical protein